jgi:hypothetical protein
MSTRLGRSAGLREVLWGPDEKISEAATKVEQCSREDGANALKDQKAGARINVRVGLTLEGETKRDKKHHRDRKIFQLVSHGFPLEGGLHRTTPLAIEDADVLEKFR